MKITSQKILFIACFFLLAHQAASFTQDIRPVSPNPHSPQTELRHVSLLLNEEGKIEEVGYMKLPLKVFNQYVLTPSQTNRLKKWDTFDVVSDEFYLAIALANLGTTGLIRVNFFDFKTGKSLEFSTSPKGDDIPRLSQSTYRYTNGTADDISFESNDVTFRVENLEYDFSSRYFARNILLNSEAHNIRLELHLNVSTDHECLATLTPLENNMKTFYYDISNGNLPSEGALKVGDKEYRFNTETAASGHNYARGIFTDSTYIVRARGQGFLEDGKRFSLFLNSGYGDNEAAQASGDGFIVDRYTFKLNTVGVKLNENDLTEQIKFDSLFNGLKNFKECHVVFTPAHVQKQTVNEGTTDYESSLVIGEFQGYVTDYKNKKYRFDELKGSVEVIKLRVQESSQ
jgi:hypothetical protein